MPTHAVAPGNWRGIAHRSDSNIIIERRVGTSAPGRSTMLGMVGESPPEVSIPGPSREVPLVGRGAELARIAAALADPQCGGVVLVGPGGVGKTRLARHALRVAAASGFATAEVTATRAAASIPLGALEPVLGEEPGSGATRDRRGTVGALRSARARLLGLAGAAPLVLLVDDAHHLDDASATLLLQLAGEDDVFVVATVRSGEDAPDAVTALWKDAGAHRVDLMPLSEASIEDLLQQILDGPVAVATLRRLSLLSHGLPMAVRELLDATRRTGVLVQRDGMWSLEGEVALSDRLADLIELRLAGCSAAEREAVATVGIAGTLPIRTATSLAGRERLQALEEQHLVTVPAGRDEVVLAHPLYGEVAMRSIGELRRRELLGRLADAVEGDSPRAEATDLLVAQWRLEAGDRRDVDLMLRGARAAYRANDHATMVRLTRAALDRTASPEARHLLGLGLSRLGRSEEAEAVLAAAEVPAAGSTADGTEADRMRVLLCLARSENLFRGLGDAAASLECVRAAEAETADATWREELVAHRAMLELQSGRVREALELAEPLLAAGTPDRPFVKAAYAAGIGLVHAGSTQRAAALAERALPVHERAWVDDLFQTEPEVHHLTAILARLESGALLEAEGYAELAVEVAADAGPGYGLGYVLLLAGMVALARGRVVTARRRFLEAAPMFRDTGYPGPQRWALAGAAHAAVLAGDTNAARELLDAVDELAARTPVRLTEGKVHEARGRLLVASGDVRAARQLMSEGAEDSLARGERLTAAQLLHAVARVGGAAEVLDRLEALSAAVDGPLQVLRVDHVRALASGDGAGLDVVAGRFGEVGADLLAAEAAGEAVRLHRRAGDERAAVRSARASVECASRCEGARTPSTTVPLSAAPLTQREQEVALLAADGLSSKEVADQLVLSRRTVDNHLQRVFAKLGISRRADLAGALGAGGEGDSRPGVRDP